MLLLLFGQGGPGSGWVWAVDAAAGAWANAGGTENAWASGVATAPGGWATTPGPGESEWAVTRTTDAAWT